MTDRPMRVLDFSRLLPGPYCSRILADFGFEIVKVERPGGGDWSRHVPPLDPESGVSLFFRALNRGKKSLCLNLKSEAGRDILLQLVETADVLLESFRPGVMERLGLGYETLARANPRLIYYALSGYGPGGPYRERAGHDLNYQGLSGLLDLTGPRDGPPVIAGTPIVDLAGALWAAVGILLALLDRERTGRGQRVDGSLLGGALSLLPLPVAQHTGGHPVARGTNELNGGLVCYNIYETCEGGHMTLAALEPEFWAIFCQSIGREDLLGQQFAPALPGEPAFEELCALFRTRSRQEWVQLLEGVDACCEPVYSLGEALSFAPLQALDMLTHTGLLPPIHLSARPAEAPTHAPGLGQHTAALLGELGYPDAELVSLRKQGII
jgi:alpha-methylacyl-CoA racemase